MATVTVGGLAASCTHAPPQKAAPRYATLPLKKVPAFMSGTLFERMDVIGTQTAPVSAYGLVSQLRNTGDSTAPSHVRQWMNGQMVKRGFGQVHEGLGEFDPDAMLNNPSFAIVRVDALIPPGTRTKQTFDVMVSALPDSSTSSLAHGWLYDSNLGPNGANPVDPNVINVSAIAGGQIFVNPAYSVRNDAKSDGANNSLRYGVVMDGGHALNDWPVVLRLRQPQMALARAVDNRINQRFQEIADKKRQNDKGKCVAEARDEGTVYLWVPYRFNRDWQHLVGIVTHLYTDGSPENTVQKARMLADEAIKPDAKLLDISYAWEGLGEKALPFIQPLMTSEHQDVAFASARAAAFLGDPSAVDVLIKMAGTRNHQFQLNAVTVLGSLEQTQQITHALRKLLDSDTALVRLEAYRILASQNDMSVYSRVIDERFVLDIVHSSGPPLIYASRQGIPRVAVIGQRTSIQTPLTFTAMNNQLSITSADPDPLLKVFYRGHELHEPITILSHPDVAELIARLGGEPPDAKDRLSFSYGDILGILQMLADSHSFYAESPTTGQHELASFVLQDLPGSQDKVMSAAADSTNANGDLPDLIPREQDKRPLINGAEQGARPQ
jgi:hypothetical protein